MQANQLSPIHPATMKPRRWTTDRRYYSLRIQRNLFGEWELLKVWGSRYNNLGGHQVIPAQTFAEATTLLEAETFKRKRRGYAAS